MGRRKYKDKPRNCQRAVHVLYFNEDIIQVESVTWNTVLDSWCTQSYSLIYEITGFKFEDPSRPFPFREEICDGDIESIVKVLVAYTGGQSSVL